MKKIAFELIKIAKILLKKEMIFKRQEDKKDRKLNTIHREVSEYLDTIRQNEKLETYINRLDNDKEMKLEMGISEHEDIDAIAKGIIELAEKLAKRGKIELKVKDVH